MQELIQDVLNRFDKDFVKDMGGNVEDVFIDPVGSVSPIRAFIRVEIEKAYKLGMKTMNDFHNGEPSTKLPTKE